MHLVHKKIIAVDESKYGSGPAYWDQRYMEEDGHPYDWFQRYGHKDENTELRKVIREYVPAKGYIMVVGAGTSRMSEEMNADGYRTILNTDVSGVAVRLMTARYKEIFGKWLYTVTPGCRRLYARREPEMGATTDTQLFQILERQGIATLTEWLLALDLNILAPLFRQKAVGSPRDALVLKPDKMANFLSDIDKFMAALGKEEKASRAAATESASGALVMKAEEEPDDGDLLFGADENGVTPSMRFQEEVGKLREFLGFDVERGGGMRVFTSGEAVVVVERREDGAQTHLRCAGGGWVVEKSPTTLEPLCVFQKQLPGGYPPMSTVLNPDPKTSAVQTFLASLDYKQMNGLALDYEPDTFDSVIVKGTLDSFLAKGVAGRNDALTLLEQIYHVLKPTGKFVCISHGGEHPDLLNRLVLLKEDLGGFKWAIETRALPKPQVPGQFHKAYVCTPQPVKAGEIWDVEEAQAAVVT
eukprot:CAMPEP_0171789290 /NCGR_PEP_ID=MMETSP0991-20121206/65015_1 /TAXON_ID=483369 /ORGANISM="non described non described, Strain CCMP2098" /LENGTH=471 /DNA_ID=CAMNT_0012398619 /DNA_START=50 /DNA_END=1465 /DNA_ORIENTATION=+